MLACQEIIVDGCPCVLAEIQRCRCCSLLQGKELCDCDYPGMCVYEKYSWSELQPLGPGNIIVRIFPLPGATGIILKLDQSTALPLGSMITIRTPEQDKPLHTVLLRCFKSNQLVFLIAFRESVPVPEGKSVSIEPNGNVFGQDYVCLNEAAKQSITIAADKNLHPLLPELVSALQEHGNTIQVKDITEWKGKGGKDDLIVFISKNLEVLRLSLKNFPLFSKVKTAFWIIKHPLIDDEPL